VPLLVGKKMKLMRPQAQDEFEGIAMKEEIEWRSLVNSR
jgi:hypothetical protein